SYQVTTAPLTITAANASRVYGVANPTFSGTVMGIKNSDAITASYSTGAGPTSPVATYAIVPAAVDSTPGTLGNYSVTLFNGTLTVSQATPSITWNNPADIAYGTALGSTQLNATASASGTFAYTPTAGTVLGVGSSQPLTVTFTPTDTTDYTTAAKSVTINVNKASTSTTLTSSPNPSAYGQSVTLT